METNWNSYQRDSDSSAIEQLKQDISLNIQKIDQNTANIERMFNQLGTNQDNENLRTKLHDLEHDTKGLSQKTVELLAQINSVPQNNNVEEQRKLKIVREKLAKDFSSALLKFQNVQRRTVDKEHDEAKRAKYEANDLESGGAALSMAMQQRTQAQQQIEIQSLQERQEAIHQLESDISDVNQIFKDLALMVHDQGYIVDSIEANVDMATSRVEHGVKEISKARDLQSRARRKKCICLIVLASCLAVLTLIIYLAVKT